MQACFNFDEIIEENFELELRAIFTKLADSRLKLRKLTSFTYENFATMADL